MYIHQKPVHLQCVRDFHSALIAPSSPTMKAGRTTTRMREQQPTTTHRTTSNTTNRAVDEFDNRVDDWNDGEENRSKDEIESVERQRGSGSSSVRSEDDEESRDSSEPPATSTSPQHVSSAGRGGWPDTTSRDSRSATNSVSTPSPLNRVSVVLDSSQGSNSRFVPFYVIG